MLSAFVVNTVTALNFKIPFLSTPRTYRHYRLARRRYIIITNSAFSLSVVLQAGSSLRSR